MESKEQINQLLKKRDWFMPYAPSILEEECVNWIESNHYSPYMQVAFHVKSSMTSKIPSAVHVDGTSRVHSVRKTENSLYWELINEFKLSCPCLDISGISVSSTIDCIPLI